MEKAAVLVLDPRPDSLATPELRRRYGHDYEVISAASTAAAEACLAELRDGGRKVAIVLAHLDAPEEGGIAFLSRVRQLAPHCKRALLVDLGDISCAGTLLQALTFRQADDYIRTPFQSPDEQFHLAVTTLLEEWAQSHRGRFQLVRIVGERWAQRSYALRDMMERAGIPSVFYDVHEPEGQELLAAVALSGDRLPVCVLYNAEVLVDPTDAELDEAIGVRTQAEPRLYDLTIVGAGPAGLSAAVYASSEGLDTVVVEPGAPGGQAGTSSMVRNYLGFPRGISGGELMRAAYRQAWLFQTQFVFSHPAIALHPGPPHRVELRGGDPIRSRAVLLATGIAYRRLGIPAIDRLVGAGVYYGTAVSEAQAMRGRSVFVVGAGNSAGQAAVHLAKYADQVTVLVRGDSLAGSMSKYLRQELLDAPNISVRYRSEVAGGAGQRQLERLTLRDRASGEEQEVDAGALFILIGGAPHGSWLPDAVRRDRQGYVLTGRDLLEAASATGGAAPRAPMPFETSVPGIFAAGDLRHGSAKRIAGAVGDGSAAIQYVHKLLAER